MSGIRQMFGRQIGIGVAELKVEGDVQAELDLPDAAIRLFERLELCGGEGPFSWEGIPHEQREMIADMIGLELVKEREYVSHQWQVKPDRLALALTDKGRNVLAAHRKRKIVAGAVKDIKIEP